MRRFAVSLLVVAGSLAGMLLASSPATAMLLVEPSHATLRDVAGEVDALAREIEHAEKAPSAQPPSLTASLSAASGFRLFEATCPSPPLCLAHRVAPLQIEAEPPPLELTLLGNLTAEKSFRLFARAARSSDSARHRYYDPQMGRFISADPMGYVDGPSMYQYGLNNPIDNSDPMGLCVGPWKDACWDRVMYFLEGDPEAQVADQILRNQLRMAYVKKHGVPLATDVVYSEPGRDLLGSGKWTNTSGHIEADHAEWSFVAVGVAGRAAYATTRAAGGSMLRASGSAAVAVADEGAGNVIGVNPSVVNTARRFFVDPSGTAIPGSASQNWQSANVIVPEGHVLSARDLGLAAKPQVIAGPFTDAQRRAFLQGSGGGTGIGPHHRHQIPVTWGGIIDEVPGPGHPLGNQHTAGSPTRHPNRPAPFSRLPGGATLRKQEIRDHFKAKGARLVEIAPGVWIDNGY